MRVLHPRQVGTRGRVRNRDHDSRPQVQRLVRTYNTRDRKMLTTRLRSFLSASLARVVMLAEMSVRTNKRAHAVRVLNNEQHRRVGDSINEEPGKALSLEVAEVVRENHR